MANELSTYDYIVVGGGISGLTAAFYLKRSGHSVLVLEASNRVGGVIASTTTEGYLLELGPNTVRNDRQELEDLIFDLGIESHIRTPAIPKLKNYVAKNGKLYAVPRGPLQFIGTSLLSAKAKLQITTEPFGTYQSYPNESVAAFFRRHLGAEAVETLVKPINSGIYAGDAEKLEMRSSFPKLWEHEQKFGSILKGFIKSRKSAKRNRKLPRIFSFDRGMQVLIDSLASALGNSIKVGQNISVEHINGNWKVTSNEREEYSCGNIVFASSIHRSKEILKDIFPSTFALPAYPPLAVVQIGYDRASVQHSLDGFGFLTLPSEKSDILGCIFSSELFPDRAPTGKTLLKIMMGGQTNPAITSLPPEDLLTKAHKTVSNYLGITAEPTFSSVAVLPHSIPQYNIGHSLFIKGIEALEGTYDGLHFIGNYRGGISVGSCISSARSFLSPGSK